MFQRIVVPLDGSRFAEAALAPACELASAFGSRIFVMRAVGPQDMLYPSRGERQHIDIEQVDEADAYLHRVTDRLRRAGYDADLLVTLASAGAGIAQSAAVERADLVVMAGHLRWKVPASTTISASLNVLVQSHVPLLVWRVGATEEWDGREGEQGAPLLANADMPLIVPLDGSPLAEQALPYAESLARGLGLSLVLVRATSQADTGSEAQQYMRRIETELEQRGVHVTSVTHVGDPLSVIEMAWRKHSGELIVMASRGQPGPHGTFFGSLAARIIEEVEAPVLVVRPPAVASNGRDDARDWIAEPPDA
jgi:nucleotide-binding universal stress UspA family protein